MRQLCFEFSESTERRKAVLSCFARISSFRTMTEVDAASRPAPFGAGLDSERLRLVYCMPGNGCCFRVRRRELNALQTR